jgi:hypothetical protein
MTKRLQLEPSSSETFNSFLADCCILRSDVSTRAKYLLFTYRKWSGNESMSAKRLAGLLHSHGFCWYRSNGIHYIGIALKNEPEKSQSYPVFEPSQTNDYELMCFPSNFKEKKL